jgi:hypothetical protein
VVGVDGSEAGFEALRQARRLLAPSGRLLAAIAVEERFAVHAGMSAPKVLDDLRTEAGGNTAGGRGARSRTRQRRDGRSLGPPQRGPPFCRRARGGRSHRRGHTRDEPPGRPPDRERRHHDAERVPLHCSNRTRSRCRIPVSAQICSSSAAEGSTASMRWAASASESRTAHSARCWSAEAARRRVMPDER